MQWFLVPSFHNLHKEHLAQWPPFVYKIQQKPPGGNCRKIGWGCAACFLKLLPYFRPKSVIFPTLFQTWLKILYPISDLKPWNPTRGQSTWQAVMTRTRLEMILSPNNEEVASSKKHTQFKTRGVHKPYPISDQKGYNWYPISDQHGWKTIPFPAAHTYIAIIREYPLPPPPWAKTHCRLWVLLLTQARLIISTCSYPRVLHTVV